MSASSWREVDVRDADLGVRCLNALVAAGVRTLGEADDLGNAALVRTPNMGRSQVRHLRERIAALSAS